jgi:hypothetical protein
MANKPYKLTPGDRNEIAGGDQEMENRSQTRGPGRGPMSRNGMGRGPMGKPKGAPFTGGSTYRKP